MNKGIIALERVSLSLKAGFSIRKNGLNELVNHLFKLHPLELKYFNNLKFEKRKLSFLLGRFAAKEAILELYADENISSLFIDFGVFQFPVVKNSMNRNIQVCITHCDNLGIAVSFPEGHPVAVDIELVQDTKIEVIKTQISSNEFDLIKENELSLAEGCAMIWTIKEALAKSIKTGMTLDFRLIQIKSLKKEGLVYITTFLDFYQYKAVSCFSGNYICSIVLPKNTNANLTDFWNSLHSVVSK